VLQVRHIQTRIGRTWAPLLRLARCAGDNVAVGNTERFENTSAARIGRSEPVLWYAYAVRHRWHACASPGTNCASSTPRHGRFASPAQPRHCVSD